MPMPKIERISGFHADFLASQKEAKRSKRRGKNSREQGS